MALRPKILWLLTRLCEHSKQGGALSPKGDMLRNILLKLQNEDTSDDMQDYIDEIMNACKVKRNPLGFFAPASVQELLNLLGAQKMTLPSGYGAKNR